MTFDITAPDDTLSTFIGSVETLVDEAKLRADADGLSMTAVDAANVGMASATAPADAFDTFEVSEDVTLGVNLERVADVISMSDDAWHLEQQDRKILLRSDGLEYTLATIDPASVRTEPDIPDLDLPAEVTLTGGQLNRALTAADMVSDRVTFGVNPDEPEFYARAVGDTDDVDVDLGEDELEALTPGEAESIFALGYLQDMNRAIPAASEVTLELGEEFPTKMHWAADGVEVLYMVAPRIEGN